MAFTKLFLFFAVAVGLFVLALLIALLMLYGSFIGYSALGQEPEHWAQFGDFFGGIANPLLSSLALFALITALFLQVKQLHLSSTELKLSRQELELTRNELKRAAEAQVQSQKALSKQVEIAAATAKLSAIDALVERNRKLARGVKAKQGPGENITDKLRPLEQEYSQLSKELSETYNKLKNET